MSSPWNFWMLVPVETWLHVADSALTAVRRPKKIPRVRERVVPTMTGKLSTKAKPSRKPAQKAKSRFPKNCHPMDGLIFQTFEIPSDQRG